MKPQPSASDLALVWEHLKRRQKYGNRITHVGGERFDSAKEARRWQELCLLVRAGEIRDLRRQVAYPLVVNGMLVASFVADFVYVEGGQVVVEDVKGGTTKATRPERYRLKKKLMLAIHGVEIRET